MDIKALYQEVILDHNRNPRNFGHLESPTAVANGYNPLCGDKITLYLQIDDNTISDVKFDGCGCAISTASASLMTQTLIGKSIEEAEDLFQRFTTALTDQKKNYPELGKLTVLEGVKEFPSRVKCATLAWHTLHQALARSEEAACTE